MIVAFAEFERGIIRKRQAEGSAKAKGRGVYKGRRAAVDAAQDAEFKSKGLGASAMARELGIGRASAYRLM